MTPIDKDELLKVLRQRYDKLKQWYEKANEDAKANASAAIAECFEIWNIVKEQPTVDAVERKKGKWILSDVQQQEDVDNGNYRFICPKCGKSDLHSKVVTVSFCWNCGADMRGEYK